MRIGIDGRLLNKFQNTGISRYTEFLLEYYIEKFVTHDVFVITNDRSLEIKGCRIIYTKIKPYSILHFMYYRRFISSLLLDVFHIPFYSGFYFKLKHTKVIVTVHDLMYKLVDEFFSKNKLLNYFKMKYFDFIVRNTVRNADVVVSVSETTKRDLSLYFKIQSICIPENSEVSEEKDETILEKIGLEAKKFFFYCGNNRPHKNLKLIIDVFNNTPDLPPLILAGSGHTKSNNVIAVGVVTEKELRTLYESSIAFVFPSKYEGFGLPILEALSVKTPIVASRIPAFQEFKNQNIFYFDTTNVFQLVSALRDVQRHKFVVDSFFFEKYSPSRIHKLLDSFLD